MNPVRRNLVDLPHNHLASLRSIGCLGCSLLYYKLNQMFGKLLEKASTLKAMIKKDPLELNLLQATNDDNWQTSTNVLHEIASSAYSRQKWARIKEFVYEKLKPNSKWKKVLKTLAIVEFLLKNGPGFSAKQFQYDSTLFRTLQSFQAYQSGVDRGASVRQKAKIVVSLLQNDEQLQDERFKANQIRKNMSSMSKSLSYNSSDIDNNNNNNNRSQNNYANGKYQSYNSSAFETNNNAEGFYKYSHGNYGDREEGIHNMRNYLQESNRFKKEKQLPATVTRNKPKQQEKAIQSNRTQVSNVNRSYETNKASVYRPDLSYKSKNDDQLQIDKEANFQKNRYQILQTNLSKNTKPSDPEPKQINPQTTVQQPIAKQQSLPIPKPQPNQTNFTPNVVISNDQAQLLGLSISFQPSSNSSISNSFSQPNNLTQSANLVQATPTYIQPVYSQPINQIYAAQNKDSNSAHKINSSNYPQTQNIPPTTYYGSNNLVITPFPSQPLANTFLPTPLNYSQTINNYPTYNPNYTVNVQPINNTYNQYPLQPYNNYSNQYTNHYQTYPTTNYSQTTYSQPAYGQSTYGQSTYSQPIYNQQPFNYQSTYPQYSSPTPSSQPYNPYTNNLNNSHLQMLNLNLTPQKSVLNSKENVIQVNNSPSSAVFKNQNISWLSSKQKNLTDLGDISFSKSSTPQQQKKKPLTNNIKIDQWAW